MLKTYPNVLVDFHATWCQPCHKLLKELNVVGSTTFPEEKKLFVSKVDTDKYPALAAKYKIDALPTLVLFKDGIVKSRMIGLVKSDVIVEEVTRYI